LATESGKNVKKAKAEVTKKKKAAEAAQASSSTDAGGKGSSTDTAEKDDDDSGTTTIVIVVVVGLVLLMVVAGGAFYFVNATGSKSAGHAASFENPMYASGQPAANQAAFGTPVADATYAEPFAGQGQVATSGYMDVPGQQQQGAGDTSGYMDVQAQQNQMADAFDEEDV